MKKLLFVLTLMIESLFVSAQQNRVTLTLNEFSKSKYEQIYDDTEHHLTVQGIALLPSLGYYRLIGKEWGIGAEIGYRPYHYTANSNYLRTNTEYAEDDTKITYHSFYISPAIFEQYAWKKYRFVVTLSLPVEHTANFRVTETLYYRDRATNEELYRAYGTQTNADRLKVGVFANLGIQRKIVGSLYFGAQLGFGIDGETIFGSDNFDVTRIESGITTQLHDETQNPRYSVFSFNTRETISLNYYF